MKESRHGEDIIITPQHHLRTLIWLHGFSQSAEDYLEIFTRNPIPNCKVILPTAPSRPIPSLGGDHHRAWFTRLGFKYHESIEPSLLRIVSLLEEESKRSQSLFIGGFSQGAIVALIAGLTRFQGDLSGILCFSGFAMRINIPESRKKIPVLVHQGKKDELIEWKKAIESYQSILEGVDIEFRVDHTCGHELGSAGFNCARDWILNKKNNFLL